MSRCVEIDFQVERAVADADALLQQIYEENGGMGSVQEFLVMGATDPQDGEEKHWGTMTPGEQKLWNDLHATGLTSVGVDVMSKLLAEDD